MSIYLTNPDVILIIQLAIIAGFLFLASYTMFSYIRMKNKVIFYISLAFAVIAVSVVLRITLLPLLESLGFEEAYVEAIIEATQFLAAFFFFYGLRVLKKKKEVED